MPNTELDFFRKLAENSADIICYVGLDNIKQYVSPACRTILGWEPEELVGTGPEFLLHPEDLPKIQATARRNREIGGSAPSITVRSRRKDGTYAWIESEARMLFSAETGKPERLVLVLRDVTARNLEREQLAALAITDSLTGLLNRRGFDAALDEAWHQTLRHGSQISLLLLDLDHFKSFNDSFGHQAGDDCLRTVATTVASSLPRDADQAARYGGEELAVILPGTDTQGGVAVAERIRGAVQALRIPHPAASDGGRVVSISIGVAGVVARQGGSLRMPESLLVSADAALYKAKQGGRNRVALNVVLASLTG